jgi:uncharacterized protein YggU (UPF0235/DUF167 family)
MLIKIKVIPNSKKDGIIKRKDDKFEDRVKEKAEEGRANRKVIKVLANYFKIDESKIRLVKVFKERKFLR